jgi:hypothetical protein
MQTVATAVQSLTEVLSSSTVARKIFAGTARQMYMVIKAFLADLHAEYASPKFIRRYPHPKQQQKARMVPLYKTKEFPDFVENLDLVLTPWNIGIDLHMGAPSGYRDPIYQQLSFKLFNGYATSDDPPRIVADLEAGAPVGEALTWNAKDLLKEYGRMLRHEYTHDLQIRGMIKAHARKSFDAGRAIDRQRRQNVPDTIGYLTSRMELTAAANEFVEWLRQGFQLLDNPRYAPFMRYGRNHPSRRRLWKQMYLILQQEKNPQVMQRFRQQIKAQQATEA